MIDKTDMETRAIKHARQNLAEVLTEMELMAPFHDRSAAEIDRIIEACVDGFQEGMQCQTPERDPLERPDSFLRSTSDDRPQSRLRARSARVRATAATVRCGELPHRRRARGAQPQPAAPRLSRRQPHRRALRAQARLRVHPHPDDAGADFDGPILRVFDAGSQPSRRSPSAGCARPASTCAISVPTASSSASQAAGGRLRGHIDGVILAGPDIGVRWPALWEHKALNAKSWTDLVKRGVRLSKPVYYAQVQLYMAYMELGAALFTALNKDSQALHHEVVPFEPAEAQALSDKAVAIIRAADAGELPPRMAAAPTSTSAACAPGPQRCWEGGPA